MKASLWYYQQGCKHHKQHPIISHHYHLANPFKPIFFSPHNMEQSHVDYFVASFWLHRHVWSVIPQNFRYGQGSYVLGSCVNILLVCEARMRPDLNRHDWNMRRNNLRFLHRTTIAETLLSWTAFHMCVCVICVCVHRSFYKPKKVRTVLYIGKLSRKIWWRKDFRWSLTGATKRCHAPKFMEKTSSNNHKNLELHSSYFEVKLPITIHRVLKL